MRALLCLLLIFVMATVSVASATVEEVPKMARFDPPDPYIEDVWTNRGLSAGYPWANQTLLVSGGTGDEWRAYRSGEDDATAWGTVTVTLENDYSTFDVVEFLFATRDTAICTHFAEIYWDDVKVFEWSPKQVGDELVIHTIQLNVKQLGVDVSPGDHVIKLVAHKGGGYYDFAHLNSLKVRAVSQTTSVPNGAEDESVIIDVASGHWTVLRDDTITSPEERALKLLDNQFQRVAGAPLNIRLDGVREASDGQDRTPLMIVANLDSPLIAPWHTLDPDLQRAIEELAQTKLGREQGYVLARVLSDDGEVMVAGGLSAIGTAYAAADLTTRLYRNASGGYITLDRRVQVETPHFQERGIYLNLPKSFGVGKVMPVFWDDADWERFFDEMLLARLNYFYFFFWYDALAYPGVSAYEENVKLNEQIRRAIHMAHNVGMRVGYMFSPSMIPVELYHAHPDLQSVNPYPGNPIFNPGNPRALELMQDVYRHQLEWFSEADIFHVWFYDPGGDFSESSKVSQADQIIHVAQVFGEMAQEINPKAQLRFNAWPIWILEEMYHMTYQTEFMQKLSLLQEKFGHIHISDSNLHGRSALLQARDYDLIPETFIYETGVETGYFFVTPMLDMLRTNVTHAKRHGYPSAYFMHLEEGSKIPQSHFAGAFLWDPSVSDEEALTRYTRWVTADERAAIHLNRAFAHIDEFVLNGSPSQELGAAILQDMTKGFAYLNPEQREDYSWLLATAEGLKIIADAMSLTKGGINYVTFKGQFIQALAQAERFQPWSQSERILTMFDDFVEWIRIGWNARNF